MSEAPLLAHGPGGGRLLRHPQVEELFAEVAQGRGVGDVVQQPHVPLDLEALLRRQGDGPRGLMISGGIRIGHDPE